MSEFKVLEGSWKGHVGEFVRHETAKAVEVVEGVAHEVDKVVGTVLRMPAGRLVEFKPEHVDMFVAPPAEPKAAE